MTRFLATMNGAANWSNERRDANTVLIGPAAPLASLLRIDSDYKLGYEDKIAVVFVRVKR